MSNLVSCIEVLVCQVQDESIKPGAKYYFLTLRIFLIFKIFKLFERKHFAGKKWMVALSAIEKKKKRVFFK